MGVRNHAPYLDDSVGSILAQSFEDFELVVVVNGSTDGSAAILRRHARSDRRVRVFESERALGVAGSSNYAIARSEGPLVAAMNADDVSHPDRLARQREVLDTQPDVVLVGTLARGIDPQGRRVRPVDRSQVFRRSVCPLVGGGLMFRRDAFERIGGYVGATEPWEDFDLCLRLADHGRVMVLPDGLYDYRYHAECSTATFPLQDAARAGELLRRSLAERRSGRDHSALVDSQGVESVSADAIASTLHSRGAIRLWAGSSPGVLGDLLACGPRLSRTWLRTLAWAAWGAASPRSLRFVLRSLVRMRDLAAAARLDGGRPYEWRLR
jgi:GT2 family glycosyltransferase